MFGKKYCIMITRVTCKRCHRIHAILIEGIVPYSQVRFEYILYMIQNRCTDDFDISNLFYILNKCSLPCQLIRDIPQKLYKAYLLIPFCITFFVFSLYTMIESQ
ncbi:DUF6431 domain-containing protein [Thomasclavelia ramosa]|uniref:DUF6431 domain-containing protein n=1 Tax=Thomasclavelia ramosa TaxID=1547 RepID=UPI003AFA18DD